ncbi:SNF2-related protein [Pedobacter aquatilis]|uniref:SNF2-related protein n=1 Tax=Pedobacter aquatilis TaxID=351343 RepID=UPI0025B29E9B|nr:SNF2-related protein [Pedobacter aquatilis]MDN3587175.1 SNF2-related protein [Pedobacter aquatilis]
MSKPNLFDFNYTLDLPDQAKFPLNLREQARTVSDILLNDIQNTEDYVILTGFTSLSNLIDIFGTKDYPKLKRPRIVIGFDPDERVGRRLPHYHLSTEIKNYWVKQNVSIKLCGPILNIIEKINEGKFNFKVKDRLHAKIYVGDTAAILGSSNFSKSGTRIQTEANIRVRPTLSETEKSQYDDIKNIAEYYYGIAQDYNQGLIDLFTKLLKDATWEEALARAIAEILESKWMKDFPVLYQALITHNLWPSQKMGIARAMKIIQDQGRVLVADPTGSGKTKFATALAYTLFHWLWENGLKDRSNALIICPKSVMENWEKEQSHFSLYNKIESMGKLSVGHDKNQKSLQKMIENSDILVVDEAHNYLYPHSKRSQAISPKGSSHVILSTATPINKKADDLLRLVELLDIDNLSDDDLTTYLELRKNRKKNIDKKHLEQLKGYINQFIVRRTKRELNKMIEREPEHYRNRYGKTCKYPKTISETYPTGENENDKAIANQILILLQQLKGIHYLQTIRVPDFLKKEEEKIHYIIQRFTSATALAGYMIRVNLRSSRCALYEYLFGTNAANDRFLLKSNKNPSGNILSKIEKCSAALPKQYIENYLLNENQRWLYDQQQYDEACQAEISVYGKIGSLLEQLSDERELKKAEILIESAIKNNKVLAFDSTVITLDYLQKIITDKQSKIKAIVAAGHNKTSRNQVMEIFSLGAAQGEKLIALCSDAMSEGINLQDASCLVLLDMPSVLRIIEQRIGRLERMDCEHEEITVLWPDDSEAFSLKGDQRMIDTLLVTENLIGNNVEIPKTIYDKYLKEEFNTKNIINAFNEYTTTEHEWEGVKDSTQYLYGLLEGPDALIDHHTYEMYRDVDATVKTAISFVESDLNWCFFAFRGSTTKSPKWLLIDEKGKGHTDFSEISSKLQSYLVKDNIIQRKWKEVDTTLQMDQIIRKLRKEEKNLLPWKKKRALEKGEAILKKYRETSSIVVDNQKCDKILKLFDSNGDDEYVDLDHFADLWLTILIPELDKLRAVPARRRKIYTLRDLNFRNVTITAERLDWLLENCQYSSTLDEMVSACIISIAKSKIS